MYRNASYNPREGTIYLRTWSDDGVRLDTDVPYTPYHYTEHKDAKDATSIFKTPLKKHYFKNGFERNKFVQETKTPRLFGNLPVDQQFLVDRFKEDVHKPEFSQFPLKVYFIDIETY